MECPNCHVNVSIAEHLYGALYTCNDCKAVYFINFDGQPEFGEVSEEVLSDIVSEPAGLQPEAPAMEALPDLASQAETADQQIENASGFEASLEPLVDSVNVVDFDNKLDQQFVTEQLPQTDSNLSGEFNNDFQNAESVDFSSPMEMISSQENIVQNTNEIEEKTNPGFEMPKLSSEIENSFAETTSFTSPAPSVSRPAQETPSVPKTFKDVAKEISDFGNTEVQLASLNYDLHVSGIDTVELKRLFQEAIEDSRFGWDANELIRNIKNGQISFEKLNPVKAYVLAKRLQFLDIEKKWQQNAIT